MTDKQATERAIRALRGIGYPCALWTSESGTRTGIVIDLQAADHLIRLHQPHWQPARVNPEGAPGA